MDRVEQAGFAIKALKMIKMPRPVAEGFYAVHKGKPFFEELVEFMSEGPCIVAVLEKDNAVEQWRALMGATDPAKAAPGTIRKDFAENVGRNIVHGSDSAENAAKEINYFFSDSELIAMQ